MRNCRWRSLQGSYSFPLGRPFGPQFAARPLKRAIQRLIQDPLALKILDRDVVSGDHIEVDADLKKGQMTFERAAGEKQRAAKRH